MAEDPPNTDEAIKTESTAETTWGGAQAPAVKLEPFKPSPEDAAKAAARKSKFEDFLRFLKRRHFPNEYITKTVAEHVVKRLKMDNTDLWKQVNERFQRDPTRRKIFIRGIDFTAKDDEMEMVFSQFGTVERLNLMRQADNRSKGFGFIMYKTDYGAQAAVAQKNRHVQESRDADISCYPGTSKGQENRSRWSSDGDGDGKRYVRCWFWSLWSGVWRLWSGFWCV